MRVTCAWCLAVIVPGPVNGPTSHGLCRACAEKLEHEEQQAVAYHACQQSAALIADRALTAR